MTKTWIGSPNYDTNRNPIKRIIVHWFGDKASSEPVIRAVNAQFQKPNGTSSHYAVESYNIYQYVAENHVAYHAGNYSINQESIGIEHSAGPNRNASEATYETSGALIAEICQKYGIPIDKDHIEPHRKYRATQCPGTLDIDKLIAIAKGRGDTEIITKKEKSKLVRKAVQYDIISNDQALPSEKNNSQEIKSRFENLNSELKDCRTSASQTQDKLEGKVRELKEEVSECRIDLQEARGNSDNSSPVSPPNSAGEGTGNTGGDDSSDNHTNDSIPDPIPPTTHTPKKIIEIAPFISAIVKWIKDFFRK